MSDTFVTAQVFPGKTNALVKNLMKAMGVTDPNEAVDSFNRGEWDLTKKVIKTIEPPNLKTLEERYEAFPPELKAKLIFENGRLYFTVQGAGIMANLWGDRLKSGGHELSKSAKDILSKPDYDENHRLIAKKSYKLGLVFGKEIPEDSKRSTASLLDHALRELGQQTNEGLKAEFALLIREKFSNAELEAMGIWYIAVLHKLIIDSDGNPGVLYSRRYVGSYVHAVYGPSSVQWLADGAFASLAS